MIFGRMESQRLKYDENRRATEIPRWPGLFCHTAGAVRARIVANVHLHVQLALMQLRAVLRARAAAPRQIQTDKVRYGIRNNFAVADGSHIDL